jgi:nicotinamidase/pyrazinamidase
VSGRFDAATALVVVDLQRDFADPDGALHVRGGEELPPLVGRLVAAAEAAGAFVVGTQDWHPARTPHFVTDGGPWPVHCVAGTRGAELVPGLALPGGVVRKGANGEDGYSGFTMRDPRTGATIPTELEPLLRARAIRRLVLCGLATDYCVGTTAEDALRLGYAVVLLVDAIRAVDLAEGDGERMIARLIDAGATTAMSSTFLEEPS